MKDPMKKFIEKKNLAKDLRKQSSELKKKISELDEERKKIDRKYNYYKRQLTEMFTKGFQKPFSEILKDCRLSSVIYDGTSSYLTVKYSFDGRHLTMTVNRKEVTDEEIIEGHFEFKTHPNRLTPLDAGEVFLKEV